MKKIILVLTVLLTFCWTGLFCIGGQHMQGSGTEEDPYLVANVADLDDVRDDLFAYYVQTADIDLSEYGNWTPIANTLGEPFSGNYDFNGHSVSNLTVVNNTYYAGLFGNNAGTIKNGTIINADVTGNNYVGALCGYNVWYIINCKSSGVVSGTRYVGGLVGNDWSDGKYIECSSSCTVYGNGITGQQAEFIGGLVGCGRSYGEKCFATGDVIGDSGSRYVGGFMGGVPQFGSLDFINGYARGDVTGGSYVGGFAGFIQDWQYRAPDVANCYSTGAVSGTSNVNAFCGYMGIYPSPYSFTDCFYDSQTSGQSDSLATGETTVNMKIRSTFPTWDFSNVWIIDSANDGYPHFRSAAVAKSNPVNLINVRRQLIGFSRLTTPS